MTLSLVRTHLANAVRNALNDTAWIVTDKIPEVPDSPSAWVKYPNDARRSTQANGLQYEIDVSFAVGLVDTEIAQEVLNELYEPALWEVIEAYTAAPMPWEGIHVVRLDEPYRLELPDGRILLAVDMPIDIYT